MFNFIYKKMSFIQKTKKSINNNQKYLLFIKKRILFILFFIIFLFIFSTNVHANILNGNPEIVDKLNSAFEKIESWMLKLATPAAAVAIAVGIFMKKFSFGDEERLRTANKLIRGSLFSYGFILVLDLILSAINSLLT